MALDLSPTAPACRKQLQSISRSWCHTKVKIIRCHFTWTIENLKTITSEDRWLRSTIFFSENNDKIKWCLCLNLRDFKDYLSVYLELVESDKAEVKAKFKFCVFNHKFEFSKALWGKNVCIFVPGKKLGFRKCMTRELLNGLFIQEKIGIKCKVCFVDDYVNTSGANFGIVVPNCLHSSNFVQLFESQKFCDVVFIVNDRKLGAHASILASRSKAFSAVFDNIEFESKPKPIKLNIDDLDYSVLYETLYFIYSGNARSIRSMAVELLYAADKFQLEQLKAMCERQIASTLSIMIAPNILILAERNNANQLKKYTIDFIAEYAEEIQNVHGWQTLCKVYPHLVAEVWQFYHETTVTKQLEDEANKTIEAR